MCYKAKRKVTHINGDKQKATPQRKQEIRKKKKPVTKRLLYLKKKLSRKYIREKKGNADGLTGDKACQAVCTSGTRTTTGESSREIAWAIQSAKPYHIPDLFLFILNWWIYPGVKKPRKNFSLKKVPGGGKLKVESVTF